MLSKIFRIALLLPAAYWIYLIATGNIGADPAKSFNHKTGEIALYYLCLNLAIGVLIAYSFRFPSWLRFLLSNRRFLGVLSFIYLFLHLFFYLAMEGFEQKGFVQIFTKTYLIAAGFAWLILLVLALTSNNFSVRKLGARRWKQVHRFVYLATAAITLHVLLIEKTDLVKYGIIFAALWVIELARFIHTSRR